MRVKRLYIETDRLAIYQVGNRISWVYYYNDHTEAIHRYYPR